MYKYFTNPYSTPTRIKLVSQQPYHSNATSLRATRKFHGVGPSISWNASAPFAGDAKDGELTLDWGLNAALLFGRQRTKTHHQTTGRHHTGTLYAHPPPFRPITYQGPAQLDHTRSRNIVVPNVGGFAGLSYQYADAKLSLGYRADFFIGAIDGGIDTRKDGDRGFFGPFASISIGMGD